MGKTVASPPIQLRDTIPSHSHSPCTHTHTSPSLPLLTTVSPSPPFHQHWSRKENSIILHRPEMETSQKCLCYRYSYSPRFIDEEEAEMRSVTCPKSHRNQRCGQMDPGLPEPRVQGLPRQLSEGPLKNKSPFSEMQPGLFISKKDSICLLPQARDTVSVHCKAQAIPTRRSHWAALAE